jgi:hypothetical protein
MRAAATIGTILLAMSHLPLAAQQERGDLELQLSGSILSVQDDDETRTIGIVQAKAGYFVTDRVEVGAYPTLTFARTRLPVLGGGWQTVSETRFGLGVFGLYSFLAADARTVPYLGGQFYRIDLTDDGETGWGGLKGGLKFYVTRSTAFDLGGNLMFGLGDTSGTLLLFQFGLSHLL